VDYLSALVTSSLIFAGAQVKGDPTAKADFLVIVLVDVFGTIRDRTDYLIYNQERLRARTALEIAAVRQDDGSVVLPPKRGAAEASYQEKYLRSGPTEVSQTLRPLDDLLMPGDSVSAVAPIDRQTEGIRIKSPPRSIEPTVPNQPVGLPNLLPKPDTKPRTNPPYN
jgi:hypothetical protein